MSAVLWRTQRCASHLFGRCHPGLRALRGRAAACAVLLWVAPKCTTGAFALLQHSNAAVGLPLHSRAATPRVAVDQQLADHVRCRTHLIGRGGGQKGAICSLQQSALPALLPLRGQRALPTPALRRFNLVLLVRQPADLPHPTSQGMHSPFYSLRVHRMTILHAPDV